mgnify:CR=1 FL=1
MPSPFPTPFGPLATAMVTPFAADGSLDLPRARESFAPLIETGTTCPGFTGPTGESAHLPHHAKLPLARAVQGPPGTGPVGAQPPGPPPPRARSMTSRATSWTAKKSLPSTTWAGIPKPLARSD